MCMWRNKPEIAVSCCLRITKSHDCGCISHTALVSVFYTLNPCLLPSFLPSSCLTSSPSSVSTPVAEHGTSPGGAGARDDDRAPSCCQGQDALSGWIPTDPLSPHGGHRAACTPVEPPGGSHHPVLQPHHPKAHHHCLSVHFHWRGGGRLPQHPKILSPPTRKRNCASLNKA